jgi:hypothetical protein
MRIGAVAFTAVAFTAVVLTVVSCGGSDSSLSTPAGSSIAASTELSTRTTDAASTTTTTATSTNSTSTNSTTTSTTTTPACAVTGDTEAKTSGEPLTLSPLPGTDIQASARPCVEEITVRFESGTTPSDFPGWSVEYVDDPVYLGESGETVDIAGDVTLLLRLGSWMPSMEGEGYAGPTDIVPTDVAHIVEMRQTSNFEGVTTWAIGLDAKYPFTVTVPDGPPRLVIQLQVGG